jgi:hypothetical protein
MTVNINISFLPKDFTYDMSFFDKKNFNIISSHKIKEGVQQEIYDLAVFQNELNTIYLVPDGKNVLTLDSDNKIILSKNTQGVMYIHNQKPLRIVKGDMNFSISEGVQVIYDLSGKLLALTPLEIDGNVFEKDTLINLTNYEIENQHLNMFIKQANVVKLEEFLKSQKIHINLDFTAPLLIILNDSTKSFKENFEIFGKVNEEAMVSVNSKSIELSDDFYFSKVVKLNPGSNIFIVEAIDKSGNKTSKALEIIYEKPNLVSYPVSYSLTTN